MVGDSLVLRWAVTKSLLFFKLVDISARHKVLSSWVTKDYVVIPLPAAISH